MDEGGRKQVKFILKDGLIHIVGNHGLPNNNIEGEVESEGLSDYKLEYSINDGDYKLLKGKIVINKDILKDHPFIVQHFCRCINVMDLVKLIDVLNDFIVGLPQFLPVIPAFDGRFDGNEEYLRFR